MDLHDSYRDAFVDQIRIMSGLAASDSLERVLAAFRRVPREGFVGKGPWKLRSSLYGFSATTTLDADPKHLYHCALIVLDEALGINIGEPTMWARFLTRTEIPEGASVLQIGAGSGYYTAVLLELVRTGKVLAFEVEQHLADFARQNLHGQKSVEIRHGNGALDLHDSDGPFDLIVAFAGVTHPVQAWLKRLAPKGRMLLPVTGLQGWGAMILAEKGYPVMNATTLGSCGFYACAGARNEALAKQIDVLWQDRRRRDGWKLQIDLRKGKVRYHAP